jgi:hypothetical protein
VTVRFGVGGIRSSAISSRGRASSRQQTLYSLLQLMRRARVMHCYLDPLVKVLAHARVDVTRLRLATSCSRGSSPRNLALPCHFFLKLFRRSSSRSRQQITHNVSYRLSRLLPGLRQLAGYGRRKRERSRVGKGHPHVRSLRRSVQRYAPRSYKCVGAIN